MRITSLQAVFLATAVILTVSVAGCTQQTVGTASNSPVETIVQKAIAQVGDTYVFGVEVSETDPDPNVWDQGELTQWLAHQGGAEIPGSSVEQYLELKLKGLLIPIENGLNTPGALLFHFSSEPQPGGARPQVSQVALSLGDGRAVEAHNEDVGVVIFTDASARYHDAALLPGLDYTVVSAATTPTDSAGVELNIDSVMNGIRQQESHGDYHAHDPVSSASGAYLYIDSRWDRYGGYSHASDAPPGVQDAKMRADCEAAYERLDDWERVIAAHYAGDDGQAGPKSGWDRVPGQEPDDHPTIREFVDGVLQHIVDAQSAAHPTTG